ncbi:tRNA (uracil-5-)-methyltransferase homolog A-like [Chironomus tepperi]|uniref:tRNA (uracil-5-)-methyltransferase homolog A-like n=1 Tax=Chironomus tepperi TaxID=113505 RepID=UPI00391EFFC8
MEAVQPDESQAITEHPQGIADKLENDEFAYLKHDGFSSEAFKIEIKNLPKHYGYAELKKLIIKTLTLNACKIKIPKQNSSFVFVCLRSDEDRTKALDALNGYKWRGNVLKAVPANPIKDPLIRKRKNEDIEDDASRTKQIKTAVESSEPLGNVPYEEQLVMKQQIIDDVLKHFKVELRRAIRFQGKFKMSEYLNPTFEMLPIVPSPQTSGYRNKCEFSIGRDASGEIQVGSRVGSYQSGSIYVESTDGFKMSPQKMKDAANIFKKFVAKSELDVFSPVTCEGYFRQLTIRLHNDDKEMMLIVGIHPQKMTEIEKEKLQNDLVKFFTEEDGKCLNVTSLYYEEIEKRQSGQQGNVIKHLYGSTHVHDFIHGLKFRISPTSFFQGNTKAAEKLYQEIINFAGITPSTTVLDVCCGTGTIGLCCSKLSKKVYGMEIIPQAIEDAKHNAQVNDIKNSYFAVGNADDLITTMIKQANVNDDENIVAIVDPPRAGLSTKSIQQLRNSKKIQRLVYVSCSPKQAIKNFIDLCKNSTKTMKGVPFEPKIVRAVDMFPNTNHCELVVMFERKKVEEPKEDVEENNEVTTEENADGQE